MATNSPFTPLKAFLATGAAIAACVAVPLAGLTDEGLKRPAAAEVDFDRDVRPILSENCFTCHGFDENARKAGLRLDLPEGAVQVMKSGKRAVVPGDLEKSELIRRVVATNALQMPPAALQKPLKPAQIETLKRWVLQGGKYSAHWAFVAPQRVAPPKVKNTKWPLNPIDNFVLARLEQEGLRPSPVADRYTLIRRLSFDLTGLPPTRAETNAFIADKAPGAYERLVDRLLASPHYGERMALRWLDLARYADTHGYHIDSHRDMWPWRDWVIRAYNQNKPFDQFTIEQLAGDLLPNPTLDQRIATGFNRNHPINFEGGAIPEEYHVAYIADRINTTATTWMGLTMSCSQCHDHKYDPLKQKEYYQFFAFFNGVPEQGLDGSRGNAVPYLKAPTPEQSSQLAAYDQQLGQLDTAMKSRTAAVSGQMATWMQTASASVTSLPAISAGLVAHYGLDEMQGAQARDQSDRQEPAAIRGNAAWAPGQFGGALKLDGATYGELKTNFSFDSRDRFSYGAWVNPPSDEAGVILSRMNDAQGIRGWDLYLGGRRAYVHLIDTWDQNAIRVNTKAQLEANKWSHVFVTYDGSSKAAGVKIYINGKLAPQDVTVDKLNGTIRVDTPTVIGRRNPSAPFKGLIDEVRIYNRELTAAEVDLLARVDGVRQIAATPAEKRTAEQKSALEKFYLEQHDEPFQKLIADKNRVAAARAELDKAIPTTMVMQEMEKPRDTFLLIRGAYDQKGEKVTPGVPAMLPGLPKGQPANRMGLAKWLVDPSHPLTSRVAVNRFWEMHFGAGLVRTPENFGTQGERPTHPELLDWLSTEFIRIGWDMKALHRLIVTSAAYRQSSRITPELREKDPENRLLARAPRVRLAAELIRDQALAVSGLLVPKIGGPSVKPYQPPRLWEEIAFGGDFTAQTYVQDHGDKLYRRSMYTFWKRTSPPPSLQAFDAPEREFCMVSRSTSNTPLQALVLMNDPTYVESARKFAERLLTETSATPKDRVSIAFQMALTRPGKSAEIKALVELYEAQLARYQKDRPAAEKLLSIGESSRDPMLDVTELAAWTGVCNVLLSLDE
ncbi:MAG: DUF1553 domain-containing protein, partial [Actinomycetota bacterium]